MCVVVELTRARVSRQNPAHQIDRSSAAWPEFRNSVGHHAIAMAWRNHGLQVKLLKHGLSQYESGLNKLTATLVVRISIILTQLWGFKLHLHTLVIVR